MNKFKKLYAVTHRGGSMDNFSKLGIHSRIPVILKGLSPKAILVLSYIDIDQMKDNIYKLTGSRQGLSLSLIGSILGISTDSVARAIKELKERKLIKVLMRGGKPGAFISNINKYNIKYQIFSLTFLARKDISIRSKELIIKLLMLNVERITNLGNISALSRELDVSRPTIYKIFDELDNKGYIYEISDGIFALDIERLMSDSESIIVRELGELRARVKKLAKEIRESNK